MGTFADTQGDSDTELSQWSHGSGRHGRRGDPLLHTRRRRVIEQLTGNGVIENLGDLGQLIGKSGAAMRDVSAARAHLRDESARKMRELCHAQGISDYVSFLDPRETLRPGNHSRIWVIDGHLFRPSTEAVPGVSIVQEQPVRLLTLAAFDGFVIEIGGEKFPFTILVSRTPEVPTGAAFQFDTGHETLTISWSNDDPAKLWIRLHTERKTPTFEGYAWFTHGSGAGKWKFHWRHHRS